MHILALAREQCLPCYVYGVWCPSSSLGPINDPVFLHQRCKRLSYRR